MLDDGATLAPEQCGAIHRTSWNAAGPCHRAGSCLQHCAGFLSLRLESRKAELCKQSTGTLNIFTRQNCVMTLLLVTNDWSKVSVATQMPYECRSEFCFQLSLQYFLQDTAETTCCVGTFTCQILQGEEIARRRSCSLNWPPKPFAGPYNAPYSPTIFPVMPTKISCISL